MKLLIAGSRKINKEFEDSVHFIIDAAIKKHGYGITEVLSGGAKGVDVYGQHWAEKRGIPVVQFIPNWKDGKDAGMVRNGKMVDACDVAMVFWDGHSKGTMDTLSKMLKARKPLFENRFAWVTNEHNIIAPNIIVGPWKGAGV